MATDVPASTALSVYDEKLSPKSPLLIHANGVPNDRDLPFSGPGTHYAFEDAHAPAVSSDIDASYSPTNTVQPGNTYQTFFDDFYNRIHIHPVSLDVGDILSDVVQSVTVWNACLETKPILDFSVITQAGFVVELDPVGTYPYDFIGQQLLRYQVRVEANGPATVDAGLVWTIDGVTYTLNVSGARIVAFPFAPQWTGKVKEFLEYKTEIIESFDKSEERSSLRMYPRTGISFKSVLQNSELSLLQSQLYGWQNRTFGVPHPARKSRLVVGANVDDTSLILVENKGGFVEGALGMIKTSTTAFETFKVLALNGNHIDLENGLLNPWPVDAYVYPVFQARLNKNVSWSLITDGVAEYSFNFSVLPSQRPPYLPDNLFSTMYHSEPVITWQPNWVNALSYASEYEIDVYDYGGAQTFSETAVRPSIERAYTWLLKNHGEVDAFISLANYLKGQRNTVLIPSWRNDFVLLETLSASSQTLTVEDNGYKRFIDGDAGRSMLFIELKTGEFFIRDLTAATPNGENMDIGIDAVIGVELTPAMVNRISYLERCRSLTDRFTWTWETDGVAKAAIVFKGVVQ